MEKDTGYGNEMDDIFSKPSTKIPRKTTKIFPDKTIEMLLIILLFWDIIILDIKY